MSQHDWELALVGSIGGEVNSTHNKWVCRTCGDTRVVEKGLKPEPGWVIERWTGMQMHPIGCDELVVEKIMKS